jgi:DNA polymerase
MPVLIRDAETRSVLDLEEVGAWQYSMHPSTDVLLYSYCVDEGPIRTWRRGDPPPQEFAWATTEPDWLAGAFNESFERGLELNILIPRYGFPRIPDDRRRCLQMSALAQALPAKLERVATALGLPVEKDKAGRKAMLEMARPRASLPDEDPNGVYWHEDEERWARNTAYNVRDVEVEREVYRQLGFVSPGELKLAALDTIINDRGVGIDRVLLDAALKIAEAAVPAQIAEFDALTEGAFEKPRTPKLRAWLEERGIKVPNLQAETLQKVLARPGLSPELRRVLEVRIDLAQSATAGKLIAMRNWCGADGRVRWAFRHHGASTGRATSVGIQLQNMKKPGDTDLTAAIAAISTGGYEIVRKQFGDPMRALGVCARAMIVAAPGHRLLIGDLSGIESRLSAHVAGEIWKVNAWAQFDRTGNPEDEPYYIVGTKHFRLAPETAREPGKTGDLAFSYTGGWRAWARFAPAEAEEALTQAEAEARKNAWRQAHPQIVRFWGTLNRAAINAMRRPGHEVRARGITFVYRKEQRSSLIMRLLSGRELTYPFARLRNNRRGDLIVVFMDNQQGKWVECRHGEGAYGGTWLENCIQAAARDVFYSAMQRLETAGYRIVLHVHDEVVAEMPEGTGSMEEFKRLLIEPPAWAPDLPLNAKVRESQRFCKTSPAQAVVQEIGAQQIAQEIAQEIVEEPENPPICAQCGEALDGTEQDYDGIKLHARCTDAYLARRLVEEGFAAAPAPEIEAPPWDDPPTASASAPSSASSSTSSSTSPSVSSSAGSGNSSRQPKGPPGPRIGAWIYRTEHGVPYLKVIKTKNKHFYQEHWTGNGWASGKPDGPPIPYRLPELMAAPANVEVFICEGEKDAANVAALGLVATTAPEGAGKWVPALNKWFGGRRTVYILADNDDRGRRHAQQVADALQPIVLDRVVIVHFSELPERGDVSDWIHAGGTKEQLLERARTANTAPPPPRYTLVCAADIVPRPMDWLWEGHILRGSQELLTGVPGGGKSQIHCAFVASSTTGGIWPDGTNGAPRGNVIMLTAEDCLEQTLVPRLIAAGADRDRVFVLRKIRKDHKERMFLLNEDLDELERMIRTTGDVRLITIDPITAYMGSKVDSHRATDVRGQLGPLADLAERMDVALSAITHPAKHSTQRAIDHFIGSQAFIAAARIGHMAIEEVDENEQGQRMPTGRSLFANAKNNVSRKMPTLAYRVVEKQLDGDIKAAHVIWEEIVDITADQAVAAASTSKTRDQQNGPVMLLMNVLANGPTPAKIVEERGKACGFSMDQLYRAKRKIGAVRFKEKGTFAGQWFWALAEHAPEDATPED